jgi:hypothetical protein
MARWWDVFRAGGVGVATAPGASSPRSKENEPGSSLQDWQRRAWEFYDQLGEIHYAGSFYARMLSGITLVVEELGPPPPDAEGEVGADEWQESTSEELLALPERLANTRGGLAALQADYGRLQFIQGEAQLARSLVPPDEGSGGEVMIDSNGDEYVETWEMLSVEELSYDKSAKEYKRRRGHKLSADEVIRETNPDDPLVGTMMAWRFYHRDPRHSGMADSSMRAVLSDCEELVLLKTAIRNTARNRGAGNGILFLPSSLGGNEVTLGDGTKIPKNAQVIYESLTEPIGDEQAASAVTPVIIFAPPDTTASTAFHVDLRGAALYRETGLRDECIRRIAIGLDMPPEDLLGVANANHWTAWQIDEAKWTSHGAPVAAEYVEQLTEALLAPLARELGLDPRRVRFWYDAAAVVQDPDRARAAKEAHSNLTISDAAYREATGWAEDDAPDEAEYEKRAKMKSSAPAEAPPPTAEPGAAVASAEHVIGLAEACVLRCRELAGSKLRTKMQRADAPPNLRARISTAQNVEVAHRLAVELRGSLDSDSLVAGAGQVFLSAMIRMGLEPSMAERLVRVTEEHAALTLFDDEPGPLPDEALAICGLLSRRA